MTDKEIRLKQLLNNAIQLLKDTIENYNHDMKCKKCYLKEMEYDVDCCGLDNDLNDCDECISYIINEM